MDESLSMYNVPKLKPEDIGNSNRSTVCNEIKAVIKSLSSKKNPGPERLAT